MRKVTEQTLIDCKSLFDESLEAINNLERLPSGKRVYLELKDRLKAMSDKFNSQYQINEYSDVWARDKMLEKEKRASGQ